MKGIYAVVSLTALLSLTACERQPESPPAIAKTPRPAESVPAPEATPPNAPSVPDAAPVPQAPAQPSVPAGFVKLPAGEAQGSDGRRLRTAAYAIARQPITVAQMRLWAESENGRRLPQLQDGGNVATDLDWVAADAYARWLSAREQRRYRLPTEAEWLRAAQSGRIDTQAQRAQEEPPLWEWTGDCWRDEGEPDAAASPCQSRVLVGGEISTRGAWGRAPMGERRPAASFRLVLELP